MKGQVFISPGTCTGCMLCQLACSFVKFKEFNPAKAYIRLYRIGGQERYAVAFTKDCNNCGFCAKYCHYNVLTEVKEREVRENV